MALSMSIDFQLAIGMFERSEIVLNLKSIVTKYHQNRDTIDDRENLIKCSKSVLVTSWGKLEKT